MVGRRRIIIIIYKRTTERSAGRWANREKKIEKKNGGLGPYG
jgi:hypothetical protein